MYVNPNPLNLYCCEPPWILWNPPIFSIKKLATGLDSQKSSEISVLYIKWVVPTLSQSSKFLPQQNADSASILPNPFWIKCNSASILKKTFPTLIPIQPQSFQILHFSTEDSGGSEKVMVKQEIWGSILGPVKIPFFKIAPMFQIIFHYLFGANIIWSMLHTKILLFSF